ncbi:NUDIX hydrolase [Corynebacterium tapiri]|uniref:NUDIX hydrolase n=1 Tax=Corynebacterium tapiri TaxID=1448266 RepID=A0A5C4U7T0_9CORY|nr:NUDIX hydrolase [Corynebacterium tapiri]TNL99751.1 NUDIX hydrolase [Corynebacterium tapiri]
MPHGAVARDDIDRIDPSEITGYRGARLAATVLLLRDGPTGLEVWVQERVSTMPNFPGVTVFPGGGVDRRDFPPRQWDSGDLWTGPSVVSVARRLGSTKYKAHALVFAAVRELIEETGTALAVHADGAPIRDAAFLHHDRQELVRHRKSLTDVLREHNLKVRSDLLHPWARWVGVAETGASFDVHSFLAVAPEGQEPDGATTEADDANWFSPSLLLDGWRHGLVRLVLPTWAQLRQLESYETVAQAVEAAAHMPLRPVADSPRYDRPFQEFFTTTPEDRIGGITWL